MKANKFSEAQKAFILKQGVDGLPVASEAALVSLIGSLPEDEGEGDAGIFVTNTEDKGIYSAGIGQKLRALLNL
jgi:hypothetical protein